VDWVASIMGLGPGSAARVVTDALMAGLLKIFPAARVTSLVRVVRAGSAAGDDTAAGVWAARRAPPASGGHGIRRYDTIATPSETGQTDPEPHPLPLRANDDLVQPWPCSVGRVARLVARAS
jgi:hypothetical protein